MYLYQSKYTPLYEAVQHDPEGCYQPLQVKLAAYATELELRTRRSVRRCYSNHQRVVKDARLLASRAQLAAQVLQEQSEQIAHLRAEVTRLEGVADAYFWNGQAAGWEALKDAELFMETCALEHSFRDILL